MKIGQNKRVFYVKNLIHFLLYIAQFFLERKMF